MARKFLVALALLLTVLLSNAGASQAFRCGTNLISLGDTKLDVISACGSPDWQESWQESRLERFILPAPRGQGRNTVRRDSVATAITVTMEEWTYNFGPSQFIRILTFENSRLIHIETGSYGY